MKMEAGRECKKGGMQRKETQALKRKKSRKEVNVRRKVAEEEMEMKTKLTKM